MGSLAAPLREELAAATGWGVGTISETASREFRDRTRTVFDAHHREQAGDPTLFRRLTSLVSPQYFGLAPDHFAGKLVLDAGCGSNANASHAFLSLGAAEVHSVDVGERWMDCARQQLAAFGDRSVLAAQDVLDLTLPSDHFDFVHCAGVLHHTLDPQRGFRELARVTRPGGLLFITIMANGDGIIYDCVNHLRGRYRRDRRFRDAVDGLTPEGLAASLDWLLAVRRQQEGSSEEEERFFRSLFDNDLILTIKDRLQAPTYHDFDFTEAQVRGWYESAGFSEIRRLSRYTRGFRNLRRFLAPLYWQHDHPLARLWFGEGYLQMIGTKRVDTGPGRRAAGSGAGS